MKEEIIYAEIDPAQMRGSKLLFDVAGHYGRPDVFQLTVETANHAQMIRTQRR